MAKQISFYTDIDNVPDAVLDRGKLCMDWHNTEVALARGDEQIHTLQMGYLSAALFLKEYQVFVTDFDGTYEIQLGNENTRTDREISQNHNLFTLWFNGEFEMH